MKKVEQTEGATSLMKYKEEFETVCSMVQLYDTYTTASFSALIEKNGYDEVW